MLAGIGVGLYRNEEDAQVRKPSVIYEPNPESGQGVYARLFPIYQHLYPALSAISHELSASGAMYCNTNDDEKGQRRPSPLPNSDHAPPGHTQR